MQPIEERGALWLRTEGRQAGIETFRLDYFFDGGVVAQFLTPFPGGRLQALPFGFDVKTREWFDIFAGEKRTPRDWGHWTNRGMNANFQCLECHTTGYEKRYRVGRDEYESRWAEIGVGCEACHGPGAEHIARHRGSLDTNDPYATRLVPMQVMSACAPCHSRRTPIAPDFLPGDAFLDFFEPTLLDTGHYHADGQLLEESYEWGSFLQSTMFRKGVTCSDCHEPHTAGLKKEGNGLCLGCHEADLGTPAHTKHRPESPGAQCIGCHMPETVYMARDPRRDHSFPLPDPETTRELGVPNACDRCHAREGADWAANHVRTWYGDGGKRRMRRRLAHAIHDGRERREESAAALGELLTGDYDPIRRASAARLLAPLARNAAVIAALLDSARDSEALVRAEVAFALGEVPENARDQEVRESLWRALEDRTRLVRLRAAWALRRTDLTSLDAPRAALLARGLGEWERSARRLSDSPEAHYNRGVFHTDRQDWRNAIRAYRQALRLLPDAVATRHNLALVLTNRKRYAGAERQLLEIRRLEPDWPPAYFSLGLLYAEQERWPEAIDALAACVERDSRYPRGFLNLGLAYARAQQVRSALEALEAAAAAPDSRVEALRALVSINAQIGDVDAANRWAAHAAREDPAFAGATGQAPSSATGADEIMEPLGRTRGSSAHQP
jgi:predicted CXXCH cytochrome family protein